MRIDTWKSDTDTFGVTTLEAEVPLFNSTYLCKVRGTPEGVWKAFAVDKTLAGETDIYNTTEYSGAREAKRWCEDFLDSRYMPEFGKFRYDMMKSSYAVTNDKYHVVLNVPLASGNNTTFDITNMLQSDTYIWSVSWFYTENVEDGVSHGYHGHEYAEYKDEAWLIGYIDKVMFKLAEILGTEYNIM